MSRTKRLSLKPQEGSLETHSQDNPQTVELPNDETKLFYEADDVGNSTIPDLSLPNEDEEEEHTIQQCVGICYQ